MGGSDRPLEGAPHPPNRLHPDLYLSEFVGTALLVMIGLSVVIVLFGHGSVLARWLPSQELRRALAGALFGTTGALITISPVGRISGAHINPSVTFAFWLEGRLAWRDTLGFFFAQLTGAIVGAYPLLVWGPTGASIGFGATTPGENVPIWSALAGEVAATFTLVLTIFITSAHAATRRFTPWTIPPLFAWLVWWEAPLSGASTNLARSFGPAVVSGEWRGFWIYIVGPLVGASMAIGLLKCRIIGRHRVAVAKLFHFDWN